MSRIEIRDPDDEIIAEGCLIHIERMDRGYVWIGITDERGDILHVDLVKGPRCRHKLRMNLRDERSLMRSTTKPATLSKGPRRSPLSTG
jgi:hypothetical protein